MDSPLARVILASLGGYIIILPFLSVYDWIVEEYPRRPTKPPSSERIHYPFYHQEVANAIERFYRLPESEKAVIKKNLESSLISMEQWLTHLGQWDYQIMCMGELHEESTRNFLAEEFFAKFSTDVLLLEATPKDLKRLIQRMDADTKVTTKFGPSGLLREAIGGGEKPDVFASANMTHPEKLASGRWGSPVVLFARNQLYALAQPDVEATADNLLNTLLDKNVSVGTSTPTADPNGDYAWELLARQIR